MTEIFSTKEVFMSELTGSCHCKSVRYTVKSPFRMALNCHCNTCKKMTGAAFEAIALIEESELEFSRGKELLTTYQVSQLARKHFCSRCGTPIYNLHVKVPGQAIIHIGSLDDPAAVTPSVNIFCESMLPWVKSLADLKNFDQGFGS
jgi:hypothetical protein